MKFNRKTQLDSEIPTASMPDIIFMLLIFFMVTTVLREYSGLPISLPKAKRIEKLKSKRHTAHVWVSKDGLISIEDKIYNDKILNNKVNFIKSNLAKIDKNIL